MTQYDHKTLSPKPSLAESWTQTSDGKSITLKLRKGVTFHSGRAFTSADVRFALENLTKDTTASQLNHVALAVSKITEVDAHTITLDLAHPVSNLFDLFDLFEILGRLGGRVAGRGVGEGDLRHPQRLAQTAPWKRRDPIGLRFSGTARLTDTQGHRPERSSGRCPCIP